MSKERFVSNMFFSFVIVVSATIYSKGGVANTDCVSELSGSVKATDFLECLAKLAAELDRLREDKKIPAGMVVAFDSPEKCPEGWEEFERAEGRTIVGSSGSKDAGNVDQHGTELLEYSYRSTGGVEKHQLTSAEIPAHSHKHSHKVRITHGSFADSLNPPAAASGRASTPTFEIRNFGSLDTNQSETLSGGSQAHNNMQPYVALLYCKKL